MRDVVREQLRREFSIKWMTALDAPISVGIGGNEVTMLRSAPGFQRYANRRGTP